MKDLWKKVKLGEIVELKYGKGLPARDRIKGKYPVYGSAGVVDVHNTYLVKGPGIIIGRKGNVGSVYFSEKNFYPIDTVFYIEEDPTKYELKFIYHMLKNSRLSDLNQDAAVPGLNRNTALMQNFNIPIEQSVQKKIAIILSNYDDLINTNNRRVQILEQMAKLIYEEWFIKFRFPGHENIKMVDSELGKIPSEWKYTNLEAILTSLESGSRPKGGIKDIRGGIPSIGAENINGLGNYNYKKEKRIPDEYFNKMKRGKIQNKDVLLYKDGAKLGRKSMFRNEYPYSVCCINEHVFILRSADSIYQNYIYFWLDQDWMTDAIINLNSNAAQPGINQAGVKSLPILVPKDNIIQDFNEIIDPILDQLFTLAKINVYLLKTRDLLLPKLINGKIDVSNLDIEIPMEEI
jgi:type I restriction enzyme, S subunit